MLKKITSKTVAVIVIVSRKTTYYCNITKRKKSPTKKKRAKIDPHKKNKKLKRKTL